MGALTTGFRLLRGGAKPAATAAASTATAATKDTPFLVRAWRLIPEQHRPYAAYLGLGGIASAAAIGIHSDSQLSRTARYYGPMAPLAAGGMGALLVATSTGPLSARVKPAVQMLKWTAPITGAALLLHGVGDSSSQATH